MLHTRLAEWAFIASLTAARHESENQVDYFLICIDMWTVGAL